jgi:hypothetical protein
MSTDIVKNALFTVAGSDKSDLAPEDRSGGLGLAKMGAAFGLYSTGVGGALTTAIVGIFGVIDVIRNEHK